MEIYLTILLGFVIFLQNSSFITHAASINNAPTTARNTFFHKSSSDLHDCGGKNESIDVGGKIGVSGTKGESEKILGNSTMGEDYEGMEEIGESGTSEGATEKIDENEGSGKEDEIFDENEVENSTLEDINENEGSGSGFEVSDEDEIDFKNEAENSSREITMEMLFEKMKENYFNCLKDCDKSLKENPDDKDFKRFIGFEGDKCIEICDWMLHLENWSWGVLKVREHVCGPNQRLDRNGNCRDRPIKS